MKQVVQDLQSGKTDIVELPVPIAKPGMVLVKTAASMVSIGTERMLVEFGGKSLVGKARSRPDLVRQVVDKARREGVLNALGAVRSRLEEPVPLGYSSAGVIVALGEGVKGYREGDRVACAGGGYAVHAEFAAVPSNLVTLLPETVSYEAGAFTTLGAIAMHGFRLAEPQVGERVAVIGLGVLGQLALGIAEAAGCETLGIDVDPNRVQAGWRMGAEAVDRLDALEAGEGFTKGNGFDVVLICADTPLNDPVELAGELARDRGRVVAIGAVGMDIPRRLYYQKELSFQVARSYGPGRYDPSYEEGGQDYPQGYVRWTLGRNLASFVSLVEEGKLQPERLISHRFPIDRAGEAYELVVDRMAEPFLGVMVTYPEFDEAPQRNSMTISDRPVSPDSQIRLGALGAGNFARRVLFPALKKMKGVELVGVASPSGRGAAEAARKFGFRYVTTESRELLEDQTINTIAILSRHNLHAEQTVEALLAGKHVFCEKPLAIDRPGLQTVVEALTSADGLLTVGFNRRFSPFLHEMHAFFSGVKEPVVMEYRINALTLPHDHWLHDPQQGGGRIIGEACHFIDSMTYLAAAHPLAITAHGLPTDQRYPEDNVVLTIEFDDGSLGSLLYVANGPAELPKERVEMFGAGRSAVLEDYRQLKLYGDGRRRTRRAWIRQDKGHQAVWRAFAEAVSAGGPPPIPYPELFSVSYTAIAAVEALRSGGRVAIDAVSSQE